MAATGLELWLSASNQQKIFHLNNGTQFYKNLFFIIITKILLYLRLHRYIETNGFLPTTLNVLL